MERLKMFQYWESNHYCDVVPVSGKPGQFSLVDHDLTCAIAYGTKEELEPYRSKKDPFQMEIDEDSSDNLIG